MKSLTFSLNIAFRNVIRHALSSLLLFAVFTVTALTIFWAFGFGNSVEYLITDAYRDSYGDIVFFTEWFDSGMMKSILEEYEVQEVIIERELRGMYASPKKSDMAQVVEYTTENSEKMHRWVKPLRGRIPEEINEVMVPELFLKGVFDVGDDLAIVISTPDKIINTIRYKITGVCKTAGIKGLPTALLISESSMDALSASGDLANLVYVRLDPESRTEKIARETYETLRLRLEAEGIEVKSSWYLPKEIERFRIYITVLRGLKAIILIILFPLVGTVVMSIVWLYSNKRRWEIWTYVCLGMRDARIILLSGLEYLFVAALGIAAGIALGYFTSYLTFHSKIWLQFSYTFVSPLMTRIQSKDIVYIIVFVFTMVVIWIYPPLRRIIRTQIMR